MTTSVFSRCKPFCVDDFDEGMCLTLCPHFTFMFVGKSKDEQTGKLLISSDDSEVPSELSTAQIVGLVFGVLAVAVLSGLAVRGIRKW